MAEEEGTELSSPLSTGEHLGAVAVLGPPLPRNRRSRFFLALKAGLATGLAFALDLLTGNPDHVSSTFIAVVCVSPVVLMGLRRALDQAVGSLVGGSCGTLAAMAGLYPGLGIPLAVGVGVGLCFVLGFGQGYLLAAFAALFVQAVPFGDPLATFGIRALAVATGAASGLIVNLGVSSFAYRDIFSRRLRYADATVSQLLIAAAEGDLGQARRGFPLLAGYEEELRQARRELHWRRAPVDWLDDALEHLTSLRRLLHLIIDLEVQRIEQDLPPQPVQAWLRWLVDAGGEEPEVAAALRPTTVRIRRLGRRLRQRTSAQRTQHSA